MIPTPPTSSEIAAIAESIAVRLPVMMFITRAISTVLLISKSFVLAGRDLVPLRQQGPDLLLRLRGHGPPTGPTA